MALLRFRGKAVGFAVAASLLASVCTSAPPAAAASPVSGTGKGIAGGALIGGEIGFMGLSAFGAKQTWMYLVIPGALAIGGGIGGYFIEKSADPQIPLYMLAGGMALIIPTVVITLSANAYQPGSEDGTPVDATPADSGVVSGGASTSTTGGSPSVPTPAAGGGSSGTTAPTPPKHKPSPHSLAPRAPLPFALVNYSPSRLEIAVPVMQLAPAYSRAELDKFGFAQRYEVRAPLVSVAF